MASLGCVTVILSILLCIHTSYGSNGKYILEEDYVYRVRNSSGDVCLTASFDASYDLYYENVTYNGSQTIVNVTSQTIIMPNKTEVNVSGFCDNVTRTLVLTWLQNDTVFNATFEFMVISDVQWFLSMAELEFDLEENNFENPYDPGLKHYRTSSAANKFFNRTFNMQEFYYCQSDTKVWFSNTSSESCYVVEAKDKNRTVCSFMTLSNSVIYVGDLDNTTTTVNRKLCIGDYIKLQELIVPIVVGGILAVLLVVIFLAYVLAYFRRRRREGHYETLNNNGY